MLCLKGVQSNIVGGIILDNVEKMHLQEYQKPKL